MTGIPLRVIESPGPLYAGKVQPGDVWREPDWDDEHGECWIIVLPNGRAWHTNSQAIDGGGGWDVTGTPPALTVSPSIFDHSPGNEWHGWVRLGELVAA